MKIIEQILPYFNPDYNLTLKAIPQLDIKNDLPILLESVSYDDQYEGDFISRRMIIWTLSFTMKLNFFGPLEKQGYIKSVTTNTFTDPDMQTRLSGYNVIATTSPNVAPVVFVETFEDF